MSGHFDTLAPAYMTRFRCTGDACPDTCCGTWNVPIDRDSYERMKSLLGPDRRDELDALYEVRPDPGPDGAHYARIPMKGGPCPALSNGLCSLHREFGIDALGDVCATYPRKIRRVGRRIELTGELSCPEVARQLLLRDDAFTLQPFDRELLPRQKAELVSVGDDIRDAAVALLGVEGAPVASRLHFVSTFAQHIDQGHSVDEAWSALGNEASLTALHRQLTAQPVDLFPAMGAVSQALVGRVQQGLAFPGFAALLGDALSEQEGWPLDRMLERHVERRDAVHARFGPMLDQAFTQLARNTWFSDPYTRSPSLLAHHRKLLLRLGTVRWIFFAQPGITEITRQDHLEDLLITVVYRHARTFDHAERWLSATVAGLPSSPGLTRALCAF